MFGKNKRFLQHLKYYLIPKSDKSQMGMLQRNCNVKNPAQLQNLHGNLFSFIEHLNISIFF